MRIDIIEREQGTFALNTITTGAPYQDQPCPRIHTNLSAIPGKDQRLDSHFQEKTKDSEPPYLDSE